MKIMHIICAPLLLSLVVGCSSTQTTETASSQDAAYEAHRKAANENARIARAAQQKQYDQVRRQQQVFVQRTRARHATPPPPPRPRPIVVSPPKPF